MRGALDWKHMHLFCLALRNASRIASSLVLSSFLHKTGSQFQKKRCSLQHHAVILPAKAEDGFRMEYSQKQVSWFAELKPSESPQQKRRKQLKTLVVCLVVALLLVGVMATVLPSLTTSSNASDHAAPAF